MQARRRSPIQVRRLLQLPAVLAIASTGCATTDIPSHTRMAYAASGAVSADIVDVASTQRYQAVPGRSYVHPVPRRANASPEYPRALLDRRLPPVEVVVRIVVDGTGSVARAAVIGGGGGDEAAFAEAALSAVRGWIFAPLMQVTGDKAEPLPFSQDYRFTFRQVDGRAVVRGAGVLLAQRADVGTAGDMERRHDRQASSPEAAHGQILPRHLRSARRISWRRAPSWARASRRTAGMRSASA